MTFPQTEIGPDPDTIVRFAHVAEESGYDFIAAYDHVLGASGIATKVTGKFSCPTFTP